MRRLLIASTILIGALALTIWLVFPWRYIGGVVVEEARVLAPGERDGSRKPAILATPRRIAVTFLTPPDLAVLRADIDAGFITAKLFACDESGTSTREVITPAVGYLSDNGRVRALPAAARDGNRRYRYLAMFDDRLTRQVDHQFQIVPASEAAGGLCFALDGSSMWAGKLWSNKVPLALNDRRG